MNHTYEPACKYSEIIYEKMYIRPCLPQLFNITNAPEQKYKIEDTEASKYLYTFPPTIARSPSIGLLGNFFTDWLQMRSRKYMNIVKIGEKVHKKSSSHVSYLDIIVFFLFSIFKKGSVAKFKKTIKISIPENIPTTIKFLRERNESIFSKHISINWPDWWLPILAFLCLFNLYNELLCFRHQYLVSIFLQQIS